MTRVVVVLAVVGAALYGAVAVVPSLTGLAPVDDVPVHEVVRGDFVRKVEAEGNLEAVQATPVIAPIEAEGPLKIAWLVPDGSRVSEGDVVVRFDPTDMENDLRNGLADRATAESRISGKTAESDGVSTNLELDADFARVELAYARRFLAKDPVIFSRFEIIESQIDELLATRRMENADAVREIRKALTWVDLALLEIERQQADLKIEQSKKGLRSLEVVAPHDGILVFKKSWRGIPKVGDPAWSGMPLAEIPQLDEMQAQVYVLEADAGGLVADLPAQVMVESVPGRLFDATVKKVDALAKRRVSWIPVQYFGVTLAIEKTEPEIMKPGQRVRATLVLDEKENVLTVPRGAVFEEDGKRFVYRKENGEFSRVEIELGPTALGSVVVDSGIEEGDLVALRDPTRSVGGGASVPENGEPGGPAAGVVH